jgi:hypothetical protein
MPWNEFANLNIIPRATGTSLPSYSITSDIRSFQLCSRQYGFFSQRGYKSEHNVQLWFGTIIHQVLDKLHQQYKGLLEPDLRSILPTEDHVGIYFNQINSSLRGRGIKAYNNENERHALNILKKFNIFEGARLYPNIKDTECVFQSQRENYILKGVVDILKDITGEEIPEGYDSVEIWDYKASKNPLFQEDTPGNRRKSHDYEFQMLVYAQLYKERTGKYPKKGILYFLNELANPEVENTDPEQIRMLRNKALFQLDFTDPQQISRIETAMQEFSHVVVDIEACKLHDRWDSPPSCPDKDTCDTCDLRWDCHAVTYPLRCP